MSYWPQEREGELPGELSGDPPSIPVEGEVAGEHSCRARVKVLGYTTGTHSGWLACRLGSRILFLLWQVFFLVLEVEIDNDISYYLNKIPALSPVPRATALLALIRLIHLEVAV